MMIINQPPEPKPLPFLKDTETGTAFKYRGCVYIKCINHGYNARLVTSPPNLIPVVALVTGYIGYWEPDTLVEPKPLAAVTLD